MKGLIRQGGWKGRWMPIVHILKGLRCAMISPPLPRHLRRVHFAVKGQRKHGLGALVCFLSLGAKHFKNCDPEL